MLFYQKIWDSYKIVYSFLLTQTQIKAFAPPQNQIY